MWTNFEVMVFIGYLFIIAGIFSEPMQLYERLQNVGVMTIFLGIIYIVFFNESKKQNDR